jgi:hypothetical protein
MQTPRELLVLLFALFWASSLAAAARYHGFPTASLFSWRTESDGRVKRLWRLAISTFLLNLLPVGLLWALWTWAVVPTETWQAWPDDDSRKFLGFAGAALAATSVFGMIRLYHAFVASKETLKFCYSSDELKRFGTTMQGDIEPERRFLTHFVPGILYLAVWAGAAWLVKEFLTR